MWIKKEKRPWSLAFISVYQAAGCKGEMDYKEIVVIIIVIFVLAQFYFIVGCRGVGGGIMSLGNQYLFI